MTTNSYHKAISEATSRIRAELTNAGAFVNLFVLRWGDVTCGYERLAREFPAGKEANVSASSSLNGARILRKQRSPYHTSP